jgi:hypothetical protein
MKVSRGILKFHDLERPISAQPNAVPAFRVDGVHHGRVVRKPCGSSDM